MDIIVINKRLNYMVIGWIEKINIKKSIGLVLIIS